LKAEDNVGGILGFDIDLSKDLSLSLEARAFDELAFSSGIDYRF